MNTDKAMPISNSLDRRPVIYCKRCGRELTHPDSYTSGIGPICAEWWGVCQQELARLHMEMDPNLVAAAMDDGPSIISLSSDGSRLVLQFKFDEDGQVRRQIKAIAGWNYDYNGTRQWTVPADTISLGQAMAALPQARIYIKDLERISQLQQLPPAPKGQPQIISSRKAWMGADGNVCLSWDRRDKDFPSILTDVKECPGRRWNPEKCLWTAPASIQLMDLLDKWQIEASSELKAHLGQFKPIEVKAITLPDDLKLYPFQAESVRFLESRRGRAIIAHEMGLGKTIIALSWLRMHPEARPAVVVVPASLKLNWQREAHKWCPGKELVQVVSGRCHGDGQELWGRIIIINYDILKGWTKTIGQLKPKVMVLDECHYCFVAGSMVSTPHGQVPIEKIQIDAPVNNATGTGFVTGVITQQANVIKLYLSNQEIIQCTPNHPLFTDSGWVKAIDCQGKKLFTSQEIFNIIGNNIILKTGEANEKTQEPYMRAMWATLSERVQAEVLLQGVHRQMVKQPARDQGENFQRLDQGGNLQDMRVVQWNVSGKTKFNQTILRNILLSEMEDVQGGIQEKVIFSSCIQPRSQKQNHERCPLEQSPHGPAFIRKNEGKQPDGQPNHQGESKTDFQGTRTPPPKAANERREWQAPTTTAAHSLCCLRTKLETRISNQDKASKKLRISNLLQGGHRIAREKNLDRVGRVVSQLTGSRRNRCEEGQFSEDIRVVRIEVPKPTGNGTSDGSLGTDTLVYNLQVSGHPSYYVNGVLVHNCKNQKAKRTVAVKELAKGVPHVIAMSGTPIINRPIEFYNAINLVNPTVFPSWYKYASRYCAPKFNGFATEYTGASHTEELHHILTNPKTGIMHRYLKKDVLKDLPAKIRSVVPLELENRQEYNKAVEDFLGWLEQYETDVARERLTTEDFIADEHEIERVAGKIGKAAADRASGAEALVAIGKLKQLSARGKINAAISWIQDVVEQGEKIIVFAVHHWAVDQLMAAFGAQAVRLTGKESQERRQAAVDAFQGDDKVRVFVGNIKAAGVGITLTAASHVAFLELGWTPGEMVQCEDRAHRIGQEQTVNVYYLVGVDTVEEDIAAMLDAKADVLGQVLDGKQAGQEKILGELLRKLKERRSNEP